MSYFSQEQVEVLLRPINPSRIGKDGKGFSHVEAYEIRAHLNRLLGFARWSADVLECDLIFESDSNGKWTVAYKTRLRLAVCAPDGSELASYTEVAVGDATNQPSRADAHDLAAKTSESQALKRCAANLGDQFGLSLYRKGSTNPLVVKTLVEGARSLAGLSPLRTGGEAAAAGSSLDSHITDTPPEQVAAEPPSKVVASTPAPVESPAADSDLLGTLRDRVLAITDDTVKRAAVKTLIGIQMEAAKAKLLQAAVRNRFDEEVTFGAFIEAEIKRRQQDAA